MSGMAAVAAMSPMFATGFMVFVAVMLLLHGLLMGIVSIVVLVMLVLVVFRLDRRFGRLSMMMLVYIFGHLSHLLQIFI
jgi:hypothetical protein